MIEINENDDREDKIAFIKTLEGRFGFEHNPREYGEYNKAIHLPKSVNPFLQKISVYFTYDAKPGFNSVLDNNALIITLAYNPRFTDDTDVQHFITNFPSMLKNKYKFTSEYIGFSMLGGNYKRASKLLYKVSKRSDYAHLRNAIIDVEHFVSKAYKKRGRM